MKNSAVQMGLSGTKSETKDVGWTRRDQRHGGLELSTCPFHGSEPVALPRAASPVDSWPCRSHSARRVLCVSVEEEGGEFGFRLSATTSARELPMSPW
jgi:hypothetical protein